MNLIKTTGLDKVALTLTQEAIETRDKLILRSSKAIQAVDGSNIEQAVNFGREIQGMLKQAEADWDAVKAPVRKLGKRIDALLGAFSPPLAEEKQRLDTLVTAHFQAEQRRASEEALKRQSEIDQQRKIVEAAERQQFELNQNSERMVTNSFESIESKQRAEMESEEQKEKLDEVIRTPIPERVKFAGAAMKSTVKWEVTDIKALFEAKPELCVIEPNKKAIDALVQNRIQLPGIRTWEETRTVFRG